MGDVGGWQQVGQGTIQDIHAPPYFVIVRNLTEGMSRGGVCNLP
jgi:hypothetical protein